MIIAIARFAKTDSVKSAFELSNILSDISKIGWINYMVMAIIYLIILAIIFVITVVITVIPFIGFIIALLIIAPFLTMFSSRIIGLIYKKSTLD